MAVIAMLLPVGAQDSIFVQMKDGSVLAYGLAENDTVSVDEIYMNICDTTFYSGLVNRIIQCAKDASSYSEFEESVKCKKYTDSAIRRAMWYMLTGVASADLKLGPAYTNLLAANERGRAILSEARKREMPVPIITKPADAAALKGAAQRQAELSLRADAIYSLASTNAMPSAEYIRKKPIII